MNSPVVTISTGYGDELQLIPETEDDFELIDMWVLLIKRRQKVKSDIFVNSGGVIWPCSTTQDNEE